MLGLSGHISEWSIRRVSAAEMRLMSTSSGRSALENQSHIHGFYILCYKICI
jgi:hypothetical protein